MVPVHPNLTILKSQRECSSLAQPAQQQLLQQLANN